MKKLILSVSLLAVAQKNIKPNYQLLTIKK